MNYRELSAIKSYKFVLVTFFFIWIISSVSACSNANGEGHSENAQILAKLEEIHSQVISNANKINELEKSALPCTLERFRQDKCGDEKLPFNLTMSLCASTGAEGDESKGKIVFTIEGEKSKFISRQMDEIREFEDIIMLAPVYHEYMAGGTTENQKIADQRGSL